MKEKTIAGLMVVVFNIVKEKTTAGLMAALSNMYEKPSASNKVYLMQRLFNLRMFEGASVAEHLNEFNIVTTQLSFLGEEIRVSILLSFLLESLNNMVMTMSCYSENSKLKYDDV